MLQAVQSQGIEETRISLIYHKKSCKGILSQKGSLYLTRPTLATYTATRNDLEATARELFEVIQQGKVKVEVRHTYPLANAEQVHRDLEGRRTVGSIVMVP